MRSLQRAVSVFFALALTLLLLPAAGAASPRTDAEGWREFPVSIHYTWESEEFASVDARYSDRSFTHSAYEYDPEIARLALGMSLAASISDFTEQDVTCAEDAPLAQRRRADITAAYEQLGFQNLRFVHYGVTLHDTSDKVAGSFASRPLPDGSTLVAAVPRGTGYYCEWAGNFRIGDGSTDHVGLHNAALGFLADLTDYLDGMEGPIRLLVPGYSRGASMVNLLGAMLDDAAAADPRLDPDRIFVYTFASSNVAKQSERTQDPLYHNIFNILGPGDLFASLMPPQWGFTRYGVSLTFPTDADEESLRSIDRKVLRNTGRDLHGADNLAQAEGVGMLLELLSTAFPTAADSVPALQPLLQDFFVATSYAIGGSGKDGDPLIYLEPMEYLRLAHGEAADTALQNVDRFLARTAEGRLLTTAALIDSSILDTLRFLLASCEISGVSSREVVTSLLRFVTVPHLIQLVQALQALPTGFDGFATGHMPIFYHAWIAMPLEVSFGPQLAELYAA